MQQNDSTITAAQVYNDMKDALSGMADALKIGAEHVYKVLIWQQTINAITYTLVFAISLPFFYLFYKGAVNENEHWSNSYGPLPIGVFRAMCAIAGFVCFTIAIVHLNTVITGLFNPEYGAIMEIKSFIKK